MSEDGYCAHRSVVCVNKENPNGTVSDAWHCVVCEKEFAPHATPAPSGGDAAQENARLLRVRRLLGYVLHAANTGLGHEHLVSLAKELGVWESDGVNYEQIREALLALRTPSAAGAGEDAERLEHWVLDRIAELGPRPDLRHSDRERYAWAGKATAYDAVLAYATGALDADKPHPAAHPPAHPEAAGAGEGEPVAWLNEREDGARILDFAPYTNGPVPWHSTPLYAHPPAHPVVTEAMVTVFIATMDAADAKGLPSDSAFREAIRSALAAALTAHTQPEER